MTTTLVLDAPPDALTTRLHHMGKRFPWFLRVYLTSFFPIFQWIHRYNLSVSNDTFYFMVTLIRFGVCVVARTRYDCWYYCGHRPGPSKHCVCQDCWSGAPVWFIVSAW